MKSLRQAKLLEIIQQQDIQTQEELSDILMAQGFKTTQATISRDIKEMRIIKVPTGDGKHRYAPPTAEHESGFSTRLQNIFRESVISVQNAQNIVVIKTLPGLASAACSAIDAMHDSDIVGTLAGDDTGLLLLTDTRKAVEFATSIQKLFQ